MNAHRR
jgi:hypothetical protein